MLKMLVCVKVIPEDSSGVQINPLCRWFITSPGTRFRMNAYDEYALEEAVTLKEKNPGSSVDVISLGPLRIEGTLKRALEMGADRAYRWDHDDDRSLSPGEKAEVIAGFAASRRYDLIFTGIISEDTMNGQVGPMTAGLLGIPFSVAVVSVSTDAGDASVAVESELEGGVRARCRMKLPALLAVQSGINTPRYPSLSNKLRARSQKIDTVPAGTGSGIKAREVVISLSHREMTIRGTVIEGTRHDKAAALIRILHEKSLL